MHRLSSRWVCWPVSDRHFLRVNIYEDGDVTYLLAGRKEIQDEFLESVEGLDLPPASLATLETLRRFKLRRILNRIG